MIGIGGRGVEGGDSGDLGQGGERAAGLRPLSFFRFVAPLALSVWPATRALAVGVLPGDNEQR